MKLTIKAAPGGNRVGFAAFAGGGRQILVSVAPKFWRTGPQRNLMLGGSHGQHSEIGLFETDCVTIGDSELEDLVIRYLDEGRDGSGEASWGRALFGPDVLPQVSHEEVSSQNTDEVEDLLQLFDHLELLVPPSNDLVAAPRRSPLHRPLVHRRFLRSVAELASSVRRNYRTLTEERSTIRGRIDGLSLMRHYASGDPRLSCTYDSLVVSTPLMMTICAALEWVADGRNVQSAFPGVLSNRSIRADAVALRRVLQDVESISPARALLVSAQTRLTRFERQWSSTLALARAILAEQEPTASASALSQSDAFELSIRTDVMWEEIVHQALLRAGFDNVRRQGAYPPGLVVDPWIKGETVTSMSRPDNIAWRNTDLWVFDAKYKFSVGSGPSRDDQYQMFAYSHLVRDSDGEIEAVALVYPGVLEPEVRRRGRDPVGAEVLLHSVRIGFPSRADVSTRSNWARYLDRTADQLASGMSQDSATSRIVSTSTQAS